MSVSPDLAVVRCALMLRAPEFEPFMKWLAARQADAEAQLGILEHPPHLYKAQGRRLELEEITKMVSQAHVLAEKLSRP